MLAGKRFRGGLEFSEIGLGCVGMSAEYGEPSDWNPGAALSVLHQAAELGVTLFDTADSYGPHTNELLLGEFREICQLSVTIATKAGLQFDPHSQVYAPNGRPDYLSEACAGSLRRLKTDCIDLYYLHRVDPSVPLEDSWGALGELAEQGKVRAIGICEPTMEELLAADSIHPVSAVQSELSIWTRGPLEQILPWCEKSDVAFVPYAPLGRGFLTGAVGSASFSAADIRRNNPRFTPAALAANQMIVDVIAAVASRHSATPAQVAIAWTMAQSTVVVPIPGTKRSSYLRENVAAARLALTPEDLVDLNSVPAAVGERY
ncbi:MAG: aldo/keto reductase [Nakamurella sp.]